MKEEEVLSQRHSAHGFVLRKLNVNKISLSCTGALTVLSAFQLLSGLRSSTTSRSSKPLQPVEWLSLTY